ncbi:MAG: hypothetical protein MI919_40375, partial [Holophagales bacterium]|nr:hypothetical protein [Holophagales bacterium]
MSATQRDGELLRLLEEAMELPTERHRPFLESAASSPEMARQVERLLRDRTRADGLFAKPAAGLLADSAGE